LNSNSSSFNSFTSGLSASSSLYKPFTPSFNSYYSNNIECLFLNSLLFTKRGKTEESVETVAESPRQSFANCFNFRVIISSALQYFPIEKK
jgi:hypothetical protein